MIAARAIVAGTVLTDKDFRSERRDLGVFPRATWTIRRSRSAHGDPRHLGRRRFHQSTIIGDQGRAARPIRHLGRQRDGMSVRMAGRALADGLINQRVKVENLSSGKVVEGIARSEQIVEIVFQ